MEKVERTKFVCPSIPSYKVTIRPSRHILVDGARIFQQGLTVRFQSGMLDLAWYDKKDWPAIIRRFRTHEAFGSSITEIDEKEEDRIKHRIEVQKKHDDDVKKEMDEYEKYEKRTKKE